MILDGARAATVDDRREAASRAHAKREGRRLTPADLHALCEACMSHEGPGGVRDRVYIALMHGAGLRAADLARLRMRDYDCGAGSLRSRIRGGRDRYVRLAGEVRGMLEGWLALRGRKGGPLFCPVMTRGRIVRGHRLSPMSIHLRIVRRGEQAGLGHVTPNDLRRAHIRDLFRRALSEALALGPSGDAEVAEMITEAARAARLQGTH